jgi:UDP-2-acetamido-3-amino-2,3-dideoxy-glucuronate N-acetyltransferase
MNTSIHVSASIHPSVTIGSSSVVWGLVEIRENCLIGDDVSIARGVYIGPGVTIGNGSRIQNNALIYEPAEIQENVFIGPGCIITNDPNPRVLIAQGLRKTTETWEKINFVIESNASLGAGVICLPGIRIGAWSLVGAGAIVTTDVPNHALVYGNPARVHARIDTRGYKLATTAEGTLFSKMTGENYVEEENGNLTRILDSIV